MDSNKDYDDTVKNLINVLENFDELIKSTSSVDSNLDTTVVDVDVDMETDKKKPEEKSPIEDKFTSSYVNEDRALHNTLNLPPNVIGNLLNFQNNDFSTINANNPEGTIHMQTGGVKNAQSLGELSSSRLGYVPTPPNPIFGSHVDMSTITLKNTGAIRKNSDPRVRNRKNEIPHSVSDGIMHYDSNSQTSEDKQRKLKRDYFDNLPHSPNS